MFQHFGKRESSSLNLKSEKEIDCHVEMTLTNQVRIDLFLKNEQAL